MIFLAGAGYKTGVGINYRRPISLISIVPNSTVSKRYVVVFLCESCRKHGFSSASESAWTDFPVQNAYELLGVSETSSFAEIKASFRKLAKETHPDLAESRNDSTASRRFVQILAAYEVCANQAQITNYFMSLTAGNLAAPDMESVWILSDSRKRAHYDMYLLTQKKLIQKHSGQGSKLHIYKSQATAVKEMEVVEWLKWYRLAINDILSEKRVVVGTGYFDILERDFYSAIHAAYYGPEIDSMPMELLPDCFEAEERSSYETHEVLHLVSGRDLFGMVCLVNTIPEISSTNNGKLTSLRSFHSGLCQSITNVNIHRIAERPDDFGAHQGHSSKISSHISDAYRDLELHISGRVVATASRVLPRCYSDAMQKVDAEDHIHVFLNSDEGPRHTSSGFSKNFFANTAVESKIHLGTISGLGSSPDEGCCDVYNGSGEKTHVIMKHRTLMVKHMHWYQVGEKVSVCECRCTRARLPPSKFWLFEPRCGFHDIGGWYVETYGKDKKGRKLPSQRFWDGLDYSEQVDRRLHPAMYLFALAYRTLDLEYAKASKKTFRNVVGEQMFRILQWCRKLAQ
ncbi:DnaJ domain containing protein [Sesbania bispinosa]|nr:DnaJ domain containing protein [Sesbania bispinosa]